MPTEKEIFVVEQLSATSRAIIWCSQQCFSKCPFTCTISRTTTCTSAVLSSSGTLKYGVSLLFLYCPQFGWRLVAPAVMSTSRSEPIVIHCNVYSTVFLSADGIALQLCTVDVSNLSSSSFISVLPRLDVSLSANQLHLPVLGKWENFHLKECNRMFGMQLQLGTLTKKGLLKVAPGECA